MYPLKLTQQQRESLIHCTRIKNKIKERLKDAGEGTQIVGVTRKELDHWNDEIRTAAVFAPSPHKKRLVAALHKVAELFASDRVGLFGEEKPKHEQHDDMLEWRGPFDPEVFDAKKATKEMRKVQ